jgi:hypothetical protein
MITAIRRRLFEGDEHKYSLIGSRQDEQEQLWRRKHYVLVIMLITFAGLAAVFISGYERVTLYGIASWLT